MFDKIDLIKKINEVSKVHFRESSFHLMPSSVNRFRITGNNISKAINNYKNSREEINVIKWFDDFWIYIEIKFETLNTFISISIFQGDSKDGVKNQLFRAEWDDYNNNEEKHPQPHWHITSNQAIENTFLELIDGDKEEGFAAQILNDEKSKIVNLNKIHFAMNGNWINNESDIHSINDENKISEWFQGLFTNLKIQLQYARR